ncbi:MAG: hypothetical protein ACE362_05640 [Phaeodactylibacter xiamenensis]|uniref:Uncharacterized protein n=1 Tax=Phaeodactylibacter xiamenensis TaxID=1524460 RepID=A0A098S0P8_9BACT|nr:hypothetical protein [Phaeodactylibacter xiamenensis]KGE85706.1 hypothetical protein IX84_26920 [Phaeodactylibacter xiamenensis]MCR9051992.1 hypothetical protein [bacterium]
MAKRNTQNVKYRICDIKELEVYIPFLPEELKKDFEESKIDYGFTFDYFWNLSEDSFSVAIEVIYVYDKDGLNKEILRYIGEVEYNIQDLGKFIDTKRKIVKFTEEVLAILTGIAISTVRGMIATRTFGKFQSNFHVPILSPIRIVKDYLDQGQT